MVSGTNSSSGFKGHPQAGQTKDHASSHKSAHGRRGPISRLTKFLAAGTIFQFIKTLRTPLPTLTPLLPSGPSLHGATGNFTEPTNSTLTLLPDLLAPSQSPKPLALAPQSEELDTEAPTQAQREITRALTQRPQNPSLRNSNKTDGPLRKLRVEEKPTLKVSSSFKFENLFKTTHVPAPINLNNFPKLKELANIDRELAKKLHILDFLIIEKGIVIGRPIDQFRNDIFEALQTASEAIINEEPGNTTDNHNRHLQVAVPAVVELTQDTIDSLAIAFGSEFLVTSLSSLQRFLVNTNLSGPGSGPNITPLNPNDPNPPTFEEVVGTGITRTGRQVLDNFGISATKLVNATNTLLDLSSSLNSTSLANAVNKLDTIATALNAPDVAEAANKLVAVTKALNAT